MNYNEAYEELKNEKIYLYERNGKLRMKYDAEVAKNNKGYLKGIRLLIKENPDVKNNFLRVLRRSDENEANHKNVG